MLDLTQFIAFYETDNKVGIFKHGSFDYYRIKNWLEIQATSKSWVYLGLLGEIYSNSPFPIRCYINALKLDINFMPALESLAFSLINHGVKFSEYYEGTEEFLNTIRDNIPMAPKERILFYTGQSLYYSKYSFSKFIKFVIENQKLIDNDLLMKNIKIENFMTLLSPEDAITFFSNYHSISYPWIGKICKEIQELREENKALRAFPGGIEYQEALKRFNDLKSENKK